MREDLKDWLRTQADWIIERREKFNDFINQFLFRQHIKDGSFKVTKYKIPKYLIPKSTRTPDE
jgi:hypothetical protein